MTSKERILNAIRGKEIDRVPWSPFLAYYWNYIPSEDRAMGEIAYQKRMGADPIIRGSGRAFRVDQRNCVINSDHVGHKRYTTYETPVGKLTEEYTYSTNANSWFITRHPVETEEDFRILQYIAENQEIVMDAAALEEDYRRVGDHALVIPLLGVNGKTAFQSMVEHWCGTEALTYALYDFPEVVEECLAVMRQNDLKAARFSAETEVDAFIFWEDSSTTNISPAMFEAYTAPAINEWGRILHENGKLLIHHACGHLKDIIPAMCANGIDMIESISPPPTGNIDLPEASALMPSHVGLIGGIEPTFFKNCTLDELEARVYHLLDTMKGKRFVLANSDSCPPGVEHEKFRLVGEILRRA